MQKWKFFCVAKCHTNEGRGEMSISFDKKAEAFVWQMYGKITGKFAVFKFLLKMETLLCGKCMANENILVFLEINCPAFVRQMTGTMVALRMLGFAKTNTNVIADSPYALFFPKGRKTSISAQKYTKPVLIKFMNLRRTAVGFFSLEETYDVLQ
ncbi:hypothetical protein OBO34_11235 [Clostridiales Family XIII bacterium ASD5510]|uniref:Uncharacterized protein n=1 Tax=Hominibacterium faecale TaxID=2839743 RepID=A0A9J6QP13_9FIRM|nr:hypothetical protein [Hominibacterium faecale]MCU7378929.1 hypothetical protein [Hominibacterium faecale]